MSWSDPEAIAAMEALEKEGPEPEPVLDPVAARLMADLERIAGGDLTRQTVARVMRALTPILCEMKTRGEQGDAQGLHEMTVGVLRGLGYCLGGAVSHMRPDRVPEGVKLLFKTASIPGQRVQFADVDLTVVDLGPQK